MFKYFDKIIISDIGLLNYFKINKLSKKIIYNAHTLIYNYMDFNHYKKDKIDGLFISHSLPFNEKIEILKYAKLKTFILGYGYFPIFYSKRKLLKNYAKEYNLSLNGDDFYLIESKRPEKKIPIRENENGTVIYSDYVIDLVDKIDILKNNKLSYFVFNEEHLNLDDIIKKRRLM